MLSLDRLTIRMVGTDPRAAEPLARAVADRLADVPVTRGLRVDRVTVPDVPYGPGSDVAGVVAARGSEP